MVIGVIFSILFSTAIRSIVNNSFGFADNIENKITKDIQVTYLNKMKNQIKNVFDNVVTAVNNSMSIGTPVDNIVRILQNTSNTIRGLGDISAQISSNISAIKRLYLYQCKPRLTC